MERHLLLLLAAAGEQHGAAPLGGVPAGFGQQGGLADAGRSGEGHHTPAAGDRTGDGGAAEIVHRAVDGENLGFPFE
ncbi:hypothetical protein ACF06X_31610 [Streptomyces sp. NPDC015346]|uniref:hypothetical protein n=1 Tax=Streptomyces sp. NPDC015346 TaxID=3364954 RepID=UPI0037021E9E